MNPVSLMALKLGLISPEMREQFAQWGEVSDIEPVAAPSHEMIDEMIERALQSDDVALPKVTNLECIQQFCSTQRLGKLFLTMNGMKSEFPVVFGVSLFGDIILPWRSEDIRDVLLDPTSSYLEWETSEGRRSVIFRSIEDIYYGDVKAFMLCTPSAIYDNTREPSDGDHA